MKFRILTVVAALSVVSVVAAQTAVDPQITPEALRQVPNFESLLVSAVNQAATKLTDRALQVVPDFKLRLEANPFSKGFVMPNGQGMFFVLEVPGIEATGALLWSQLRSMQQPNPPSPASPNMPRVGGAASSATGIDPSTPMTNPGKEYTEFTRQAVVDAMLDAVTLPLKEGQTLIVSVGSTPDPANPMATLKRLYLTLKAEDLIALRANRINRDEARSRITEQRY